MSDAQYEGDVLKTVESYVTELHVEPSARYIYGSSATSNAFYLCRNKITAVYFSAGSQLYEIQKYAFYSCSVLKTIDLSNCTNLASIGENAFFLCSMLSTLVFPFNGNFTKIELQAFTQCTSLKTVTLPATIDTLGMSIFMFCSSLESITLEKGIKITSIPGRFLQSTKLQTFEIPKNVISFDASCFEQVLTMKTITVESGNMKFKTNSNILYSYDESTLHYVPPSLTTGVLTINVQIKYIMYIAFGYCQCSEVVFPNSLQTIGSYVFWDAQLETITIPDSVVSIAEASFYACSKLKNITFSSKMTVLTRALFAQSGLEYIKIPNQITTIEATCFSSCHQLIEVILPANLQSLGGGAFSDCHPEIRISFPNESKFTIDEQFIIINSAKTEIVSYIGNVINANLTILESIQEITNYAFSSADNIFSISFPQNSQLEFIRNGAFSQCTTLKAINFPNSLQSIGDSAFSHCSNLTNLSFGSELNSIGTNAFEYMISLASVTFNNNKVTKFPNYLFLQCYSLETLTLPSSLQSLGYHTFSYCKNLNYLEFPQSFYSLGDSCFYECGVREIKFSTTPNPNFISIPNNAFSTARNLADITIPSTIQTIGERAFFLTAITEITIPTTVESIEMYAFSQCHNLKRFTIPQHSNLKSIGRSFLEDCPSLEVIESNSTEFIVENGALFNSNRTELMAFPAASSIHYFAFPQNVRSVLQSSFYGCKNLTVVLIPDNSVQIIGYQAFAMCSNLKTINIPSSVKSINQLAFSGCKSLKCGISIDPHEKNFYSQLEPAGITSSMLKECVPKITFRCFNFLQIHLSFKYFAIVICIL